MKEEEKIMSSKKSTKAPSRGWQHWAARITSCWQKAVTSIIETGRELIAAQDDLDHGEFGKLVEEKLPFSSRTAQRLMAIARNPIISNPTHVSHLPPSWGTLYQLTKLPKEALEAMLANGKINSETQRKDVEEIYKKIRDEGLYLYDRVSEALNVLIAFMEKWPEPCKDLVETVMGGGEQTGGVSLDELGKLPSWIEKLRTECELAEQQHDADYEAHEQAEEAAMEAAQRGKSFPGNQPIYNQETYKETYRKWPLDSCGSS
jgi:Protein of unknown function (DUF3102)